MLQPLLLLPLLPLLASSTSLLPWTCASGSLSLSVSSDLSYSVSLQSLPLFTNGTYALHLHSQWLTLSSGLPAPTITSSVSSDAVLGPCTTLTLAFATSPAFAPSFHCCPASGLLEFRSTFPTGITPGDGFSPGLPPPSPDFYNFNLSTAPSSHFPSFALGPTSPTSAWGHLQWAGEFAFHATSYNVSLEGFTSGQLGGPLLLHTPSFARGSKPSAAVLGTLAAHKEGILGIVPSPSPAEPGAWRLAFGPHAHLQALPPNYTARLGLLAPSPGSPLSATFPGDPGITAAVYAYGALLRALAPGNASHRFAPEDDVGVSLLSAWTDNGQMYDGDYWAVPSHAGQGGQVFPAWRQALRAAGIPVASLQLDPFWFASGSPGNRDWAPSTAVFGPGGFEATLAAWGNTTLYSYMWAAPPSALAPPLQAFHMLQSPVFDNFMGGPFTRPAGGSASGGLYALLLARCAAQGCIGLEVDFLDFLYAGWQAEAGQAGAWEAFLTSLSSAAAAAGIPVQLCMPLPADLLAAAALPGVSNIRASEDDDLLYAASGRWRIGLTSLLLGAVDQRPFQDGIWTTPCAAPGSGSPYPASYCQNATELGVAIGALSTGPVGLGDAAGASNATLLAAAAASNGVILKPSLPAAPLDCYFAYPAPASTAAPLPRSPLQAVHAELWQAPSFLPVAWGGAGNSSGKGGLGRYLPHRAAAGRGGQPAAPVAGTFPTPTLTPYLSLLAVDIPASLGLSLLPGDFTPSLVCSGGRVGGGGGNNASAYVAVAAGLQLPAGCQPGSPALGCVTVLECSSNSSSAGLGLSVATPEPLPVDPLARGGPHSYAVHTLAPVLGQWGGLGGGWVLLGELGKYVAVSPVRFSGVRVEAGGLGVVVEGAAGEVVRLLLLAPGEMAGLQHASTRVEEVGPFGSAQEGGSILLTCSGLGLGAQCSQAEL